MWQPVAIVLIDIMLSCSLCLIIKLTLIRFDNNNTLDSIANLNKSDYDDQEYDVDNDEYNNIISNSKKDNNSNIIYHYYDNNIINTAALIS